MTIIPHRNMSREVFESMPPAELSQEITSPDRIREKKEQEIAIATRKRAREQKPNEKDKSREKPEPSGKLKNLYDKLKSNGAEVYAPDSKTVVCNTNVKGISAVLTEEGNDVVLNLRNAKGQSMASTTLTAPGSLDLFFNRHGISTSKVSRPELHKSSSALYRPMDFDR